MRSQHPQLHQFAGTEFGIYRQVEQGQVADLVEQLQPDSDGSDVFQLERSLLAINAPLFPGSRG